MGVARWGARASLLALAAYLCFTAMASASTTTTFGVDSVRLGYGSSATIPVRISSGPPGVAGYAIDVRYDPSRITVTGCIPSHFCTVGVPDPGVVRFAAFSGEGIAAPGVIVAYVVVQAPSQADSVTLSIDRTTLQAFDPTGEPITNVGTVNSTVDVVPALLAGDMNCDGALNAADALVLLGQSANGSACTPPGDKIDGVAWGDVNCDGAADTMDSLALLRYLSGLAPAPSLTCPPAG